MNGYTYPQQQQQHHLPQQQQHLQNSPIPGGINPSMLQGGGMGPVSQGQMQGMNPMLARQQQQGLIGGMGMGAAGMNAMNGMGGMGGMPSNMGAMNGMGGMAGMNNMNNMQGMANMGAMGGMGSGMNNMGGRMGTNMDLMSNFKAGGGGGGGGGMAGMNGMGGGFDNSMGINPSMMNMMNSGSGVGGMLNSQELQKLIVQQQQQQRQMNIANNMGGMQGMGMGGLGGMSMNNQNAMNGMGQNMGAMGMGGMMGANNPNFMAMQQMQQQQQQQQMQQQSQVQGHQQQPHAPNQANTQSPHSTTTPGSSGNPYPPFPSQNQQAHSMPPPPPRPSTAMSSSSHTSASQHPGGPSAMGMNMGTPAGIVRPPTASGQHPTPMQQASTQFPGGPHSAGQQISRPGTASGHPPQSASGEPPRTPLLGQHPQTPQGPHLREMSRPPSRPQTAQSNAGATAAPQTPVQVHSPGAMRSMSTGQMPSNQMNGMPMGGAANAMNVMGGMNGRGPPPPGGMAPGAMGGQSPGMIMAPGMQRQPSMGGGQQSPVHHSHPQAPQTPQSQHHQQQQQQPGMMAGPSTPTPLSAGGRMRSMSGTDGPDGGLGMGMNMSMSVGGMPNADGTNGQPNMNAPGGMQGMGMQNSNMMPNMGMPHNMANMAAMNGMNGMHGMNGMNPAQMQQFQEAQRKAMEIAKQQQQVRMQQQGQMPGAMPGTPGAMDGAQGLGMGIGQNQAQAGGMHGMPNISANQQMPLSTPTRPSAASAQMPGAQPSSSNMGSMGTPIRPAGLGIQAPGLPSTPGMATPQINGTPAPPTAGQAAATAAADLPPLPSNLPSNLTRITVVPIAEASEKIPLLSDDEVKQIKEWRESDKSYEARFQAMALRSKKELTLGPMGTKPRWWERDLSTAMNNAALARKEKFDLQYPTNAAMVAANRKRGKRREGLKIPGRLRAVDAERGEQLVPIRLEFDVEHHKYRDTFVWNLNDPIVTPEVFAQSIIDDYGLPSSYHQAISKSIEEQLSDHKLHSATVGDSNNDTEAIEPTETKGSLVRGVLDTDEEMWWSKWRSGLRNADGRVRTKILLRQGLEREVKARGTKKRKLETGTGTGTGTGVVLDAASEALSRIESSTQDLVLPEYDEYMHEEMRIAIKLDITVGEMKLDDQFEWDLENTDPTPEHFAEIYSMDLGLAGEFKTAIAHSIREQVSVYQKSLFLVGHPSDGSAVQDDDLRMSFLPSVGPVARSPEATQQHQPIINYLSENELDRLDKEREKEANRRRKRNTRGRRGVALPDREPQKTHRTPAIGFPEIDPAVLAAAQAASAPTSRRAAAAAASVNIANMVASENGTAFIPTLSSAATPSAPVSKVPKAKGSFKAPNYPSTLLKSRADLTTATYSTAANAAMYEPPLEGDAPLPASVIPAAPEPRPSRALTAKRQREIERETKEREYADGQQANNIDGVWHCSNCGIPEDIAIGRRKGPLGDKSQCGACGKYWHRHRRPRPCEYHAEKEYHLNLIAEAERIKAAQRKKGGAAALRALTMAQSQSVDSAATPASDDPSSPPVTKTEMWVEIPTKKQQTEREQDDVNPLDRALSPASSISSTSASERPLAQMVGVNGNASKPASASVTPMRATTELPDGPGGDEPTPPVPAASVTPGPEPSPQFVPPPRPQWIVEALASMRAGYPEDTFDVVARRPANGPEAYQWKVKCLDCPGKLYNSGPEQTLNNFETHLKNRQHRAKVAARLAARAQIGENGVAVPPT